MPTEPAYLRVKVRRRLHKLGASALKGSVYLLPDTEANLEDFQWLAHEIVADGGEAVICSAAMLSGVSDADLASLFVSSAAATPAGEGVERPRGAVWVTRRDVFVDRIASAWLIRRFIDPEATFRFVAPRGYRRRAGELRFDMYQGEFTHVGDRCTFETLVQHFQLSPGDRALQAVGEIVHDIDLKDDRYRRPETNGVLAVLRGITLATSDDGERVERGAQVFEGLYRQLGRR